MKWWIIGGIAAIVVAVAAMRTFSSGVPVESAAAAPADIREFVDEQAQTRLPIEHLITMPYDGRVAAIKVEEGARVKADEVVAQIVPLDVELSMEEAQSAVKRLDASIAESADKTVEKTTYDQSLQFVKSMIASVEAAKARVESGQAKLDYANKNFTRIRSLRELNNASEEQLNQSELSRVEAEVDFRQDQLVLKSLEAMLAATQLVPTVVQQYMNRKDLTVAVLDKEKLQADVKLRAQKRDQERSAMKSPIEGVVLERMETNERRVTGGTVLMKIGAPEQLEIEADVLSQDVVRMKKGDPVEIYGPAVGPEGAKGTVARIYPAGFTKISSLGVEQQRVKVVVHFNQGELAKLKTARELGVGYRVRVRIFTAAKSGALVVPRSALFRGPDGSWQVFAVRDGLAKLTKVGVGLMNDEQVEIVEGVASGERVVLAPESTLADGTKVSTPAP
jgi:HlyD family secretion protein